MSDPIDVHTIWLGFGDGEECAITMDLTGWNAAVKRLRDAALMSAEARVCMVDAYNGAWAAHHSQHHTQELPARSVLHARYDQRRRARRRRRRS